jgi:RimJ/RimL family protein N-acetyltransferase
VRPPSDAALQHPSHSESIRRGRPLTAAPVSSWTGEYRSLAAREALGGPDGILDRVMWKRLLGNDEWRLLRDLRLRALAEAPQAFLSTLDRESAWTQNDWMWELRRGDWMAVFADDGTIALLGATSESDIATTERYLSYLWVAPAYRRRGIARELVLCMLDRLRSLEVDRVWLWVLDGNESARRLYEALGFVSTHERQPLSDDPSRCEERMSLALSPDAPGAP